MDGVAVHAGPACWTTEHQLERVFGWNTEQERTLEGFRRYRLVDEA